MTWLTIIIAALTGLFLFSAFLWLVCTLAHRFITYLRTAPPESIEDIIDGPR